MHLACYVVHTGFGHLQGSVNHHITPHVQVFRQYSRAPDQFPIVKTGNGVASFQVYCSLPYEWLAAKPSSTTSHEPSLVAFRVLEKGCLAGFIQGRQCYLSASRQRPIASNLTKAVITLCAAFPRFVDFREAETRRRGVGIEWIGRPVRTSDSPANGHVVSAETVAASVGFPADVLVSSAFNEHDTSFEHALAVFAGRTALPWGDDRVGTEGLRASDGTAINGLILSTMRRS